MAKTTIEFGDQSTAQLVELQTKLGGVTKAEILRNALALYAYLADQLAQSGKAIGIVNENDNSNKVEKIIAVPGLVRASASMSATAGTRAV